MSKKTKLEIKESAEFLEDSYRSLKNQTQRLKIKSLLVFINHPEKRQIDIAEHLCISYATLRVWYKHYRENGLEYLLDDRRKGGNNPSVISDDLHEILKVKLNDSEDSLLGYTHAVEWLKEIHGIDIKYTTLRNYLIRHFKSKLKSPRKSHYKKNEEAVESFKKNNSDI